MDRRSWLWRRRSSEKSPGETESMGSLSSHSERFSDDQAYAINSTQSPEVASKSGSNYEDSTESLKNLAERLSLALLEISTKEELVKEHAKVAEEAVSGWEKAENDASVLKKKLETSDQKNSALEDRLGHLDGALKECVRQLRQARDQEQKIHEILMQKGQEWDRLKSMLESQIVGLQTQLQTVEGETISRNDSDERAKLENSEKENSRLKLELLSQSKELGIAILERNLSVKGAESTSKQCLESMKTVAKLESEIRKLKALNSKVSRNSNGVERLTLESGTLKTSNLEENEQEAHDSLSSESPSHRELQYRSPKEFENKLMNSSVEIDLMDDFLEMERIAGLPVIESETVFSERLISDRSESIIQRTAILEEKLETMEGEKVKLEMALRNCQAELDKSRSKLSKAEMELKELRDELLVAIESKIKADELAKTAQNTSETMESKLRDVSSEINALTLKVNFLEEDVQRERSVSSDYLVRYRKLQDELSSIKLEAETHRERTNLDHKLTQEKELALAAENFAECQKTIASLGRQLKSLASLEDFVFDFDSGEAPQTPQKRA